MNCQSFENSVTDLARQHPIEASAQEQALSHAESCATCALKLEEQRALTLGLRGLADELKTVRIPDRVEKQLVNAFRERTFLPRRAHATGRRWWSVAAAAAVVLVVLGIIGMQLRSATAPSAIKSISQKSLAPETPPKVVREVAPIPTPVQSSDQENLPRPAYRKSGRVVAKHRAKPDQDSSLTAPNTSTANANAAATEVTTEFMPLGDVGVANLQEGAQVVRVEMPRYAMARFGLPVNMERYDERVKADVWVGVDGLARAIRFVQ